eukprot:TRINITY_DN539_c0_g2_i1.p1 TRINITY_DN539_c0_g2~~TRINITY_DN539_c0_g2_i1.p1  ORF type:complete len:760 (+),score=171.79 TRINITY_DN539_c0_g2_i1:79-2358(+)
MKTLSLIVLLGLLFVTFDASNAQTQTLLEIVTSRSDTTKFAEHALVDSNIFQLLNETNANKTVFAFSDTGYNSTHVVPIQLAYHISSDVRRSTAFVNGELIASYYFNDTLLPQDKPQQLKLNVNTSDAYVNGKRIVVKDIEASNGVLHIVDEVLDLPGPVSDVTNAQFSALNGLINLLDPQTAYALDNDAGITFLAPSNDAVTSLPAAIVTYLTTDPASVGDFPDIKVDLTNILLNHLVENGTLYSADITTGSTVVTRSGETLTFQVNNEEISIVDITQNTTTQVFSKDILTANGVVHGITNVIVPSTFEFSVKKLLIGLDRKLLFNVTEQNGLFTGPCTVFAPTDAAIVAYLNANPSLSALDVASYHIVSGLFPENLFSEGLLLNTLFSPPTLSVPQKIKITKVSDAWYANGVKLSAPNSATNGYVYLLDEVVNIPPSIPRRLEGFDNLGTLRTALNASGIDLGSLSNITLFAPTNESFEALPAGFLQYLTSPPGVTLLGHVLKNHVHPGAVYSADIVANQTIATLDGSTLAVEVTYDKDVKTITVGGAKVTEADILSSNGVIHIIDAVLADTPNLAISTSDLLHILTPRFFGLLSNSTISHYLQNDSVSFLAPTEAAMDKFNLEGLTSEQVVSVLSNHIVLEVVAPTEWNRTKDYETANSKNFIRNTGDKKVALGEVGKSETGDSATWQQTSYSVVGGVPKARIYTIDNVLNRSEGSPALSIGAIIAIAVVAGLVAIVIIVFIIYKLTSSKTQYEEV